MKGEQRVVRRGEGIGSGRARAFPAAALALLAVACSSGLEGVDARGTTENDPAPSTNLRFAFDPCVALDQPISDAQVTGGVIATTDGSRERPIAFVAFVTTTDVDDPDDGTTDSNSVEDVFVAAVDAARIDTRAFTYSMAGTLRHPRCMTCHQMNIDVAADPDALAPTAFQTQAHLKDGGGLPPLDLFDDSTCSGCHFEDWLAPGPTFDLRREGTRELFIRAQVPPGGLEEHFRTDPRVLWALDVADTPFGGAADDDHDGVDEPEDHDGVRRHAPGGKKAFLERLDGWLATADPVTGDLAYSSAERAVADVVLASRVPAGSTSGNGGSSAPSLVWVPNPAFDPLNAGVPAGALHLAFQSDASDFAGGGTNGASDVFKAVIDVFVVDDDADGFDQEDALDLVYRPGSQLLVSFADGGGDAQGASRQPDIGADGQRIAFVSEANDLLPGFPLVCRPEVYVYDSLAGVALVSHVPGDPDMPGNAGAGAPDLSPDGMAIAFESDATDLVAGDTNGARDVFWALWPTLDVERASVDDGGAELATHSHHASVVHAGGEVKVAFASQVDPLPPLAAVQCPDQTLVLTAVRDTAIMSGIPDTSLATDDLLVGTTGGNGTGQARSLVLFDLSAIPAGATINQASLSIVLNQEPDGTSICPSGGVSNPTTLHRVSAAWDENATWNRRMPGANVFWGTAGGDFGAGHSNLSIQGLGAKVWSSAAMAADVQSWVDSGSNFGWLVRGSTTACTAKRLTSREATPPPTLTIDYSPPIPPVPATAGGGVSCVYLRDTAQGRTLNLNRAVTPAGALDASELDVDGTALGANGTNPVLSPDGNAVLFESMAQNLDVVRPEDLNRTMDVLLVDLLQLDAQGFVLPYRVSVTADGGQADGPSRMPRLGSFTPATDAFPLGLALFATEARNLGDTEPGDLDGDGVPDSDNWMLSFLCEGGSVLADFAAEPARAGMRKAVAFESTSSGEPTSFTWDFGDGTATSTKRSPTHAYQTPGLYTVQLTVSGARGSDSRTRVDYVHVLDAVTAAFETTKDASEAPAQDPATDVPHTTPVVGAIDDQDPGSRLLLDLDSSESSEFPDAFDWRLRRVSASGAPMGSAVKVSQEASPRGVPIATPGLYDLTLTATGPGGEGSATQRVEVWRRVRASFTSEPGGAIVRGPASLAVQFQDTSTGDLLDAGAHAWDFGDGGVSSDADPLHTFAAGVWFVRLDVAGKGTDADASTLLPVIADGTITAAFEVAPRPAGSVGGVLAGEAIDAGGGALVDFANLSQQQAGDPLFFRWSFGTGALTGQETQQDPAGIVYAVSNPENVRTFQVSLLTSTNGPAPATCAGQLAGTCDERQGTITIYPRPQPSFTAPAPSFAASPLRPPHTVELHGSVIGDGTGTEPTYRWLRSEANGSGATIPFATGLDPVFEFEDPGLYEVVLEVETNGPGGSRQVVQSAAQGVLVSAATLTQWITQAVAKPSGSRCTNCHSGANPPAGLVWTGTPSEIYERIVQDDQGNPVFSLNCDTSRRRVQPGDPDASVVYNVMLKPSGPLCAINMRVNLPGDEADKDAHVAVLRSWILDGAPDN